MPPQDDGQSPQGAAAQGGGGGHFPGDPILGTGGGLHRHLKTQFTPLSPIGGHNARIPGAYGQKGTKAKRIPAIRQPRPLRVASPTPPKQPRTQSAATKSAHPHVANRTAQTHNQLHDIVVGGGFTGNDLQSGKVFKLKHVPELLMRKILEQTAAMLNPGTGSFGYYSFGTMYALGHHPHATGHTSHANARATPYRAQAGRAVVSQYNPGPPRTASVILSHQPDTPIRNVPVSPSITDAQMSAANTVGITFYGQGDGTDAVITHVLG